MSELIDNLLKDSSTSLVSEVIENAKSDAKSLPNIEFETSNNDFGAEETDFEEEGTETKEPYSHLNDDTATISDFNNSDSPEIINELSELDKKRNFLYCQLYVLMVTEGSGLAFRLISGDWDDESEKKYSLSKTKQNDIARAWAEILNLEMSVKSPKSALGMLFVSSFIPLLFTALKSRVSKVKAKRDAKKTAENGNFTAPTKEENIRDAFNVVNGRDIEYKETIQEPLYIPLEKVKEVVPVEEIQPIQNFQIVDKKQTAKVDLGEKIEAKKGKVSRGRKKGMCKNPNSKKMESPIKTEIINGANYNVYSWGLKKKIK